MKYTITLLLACFSYSLSAQGFQWVKKAGGTEADYGRDIAMDNTGAFVYVCGSYHYKTSGSYTATFGTLSITNNSPGPNGYVAKYDTSGNTIWVQNIEGPEWEYAYDIATDNSGNVYVAGEFESTVTIAGVILTTSSPTQDGAYIAKFLANGNLAWAVSLEQSVSINISDIICDSNGDIWITGDINSWYLYVRKYTSLSGTLSFSIQSVNSTGLLMYAHSLVKFGNNIYLMGRYDASSYGQSASIGSLNLPITSLNWDLDIFIVKFDLLGASLWVVAGGGNSSGSKMDQDTPIGIGIDNQGYIYATSAISDTSVWGSFIQSNIGNRTRQCIVKITPSGMVKSITTIPIDVGGYGGELHFPIVNDKIFMSLSFDDTVTIAGTLFTSTGQDHLIIAADTNLNIVGAYQIKQSSLSSDIDGITANSNNDIFVTGYFRDLATFGTIPMNTYGGNKADIFLTKIKPCIPPPVSLNPTGSVYICQGGSTLLTAFTGTASVAYQWYQNNQPILNATSATYTATQPGSYTVAASISGACQALSSPVVVNFAAINAQLQAAKSSICAGTTTQISTTLPYAAYTWSTGQTGVSSVAVGPGNYSVIVTDANACKDTAFITVNSFPTPSQPDILADANCWLACDTALNTGAYKWKLYGSVVGGNTQYLNASLYGNGFYKVEITDINGCKAMSADKSIVCAVGVDLPLTSDDIVISPNPATESITITLPPSIGPASLLIIDPAGREMAKRIYSEADLCIDVSEYAVGVYFVKFMLQGQTVSKKFVVLR